MDGSCVALSACPPGINGCVKVGAICDEENDTCLDEPDDSLCDNGLFCDGAESCDPTSGQCQPGLTCPAAIDGCKVFGACDEDQDECISELDDELCEEGEFCNEGGRCQIVEIPHPPELLFGQVAIGSQGDLEIQSVISATNSGSMTYEGDFSFFTGNGTGWNPLVDGVEITNGQHSILIPPFETISLTLTGAEIEAGSAILRGTGPPETAIDGNLTYFFRTAGALTDSIGVGPSAEIYRFTIPFQNFSTIALALANQDPTTKDVVLKLRQADGTLQETKNVQLAGNAHDARFLDQIFDATTVAGKTVTGGRVDIESNELIFGTAVTFIGGQISTLPMQPARIEYDFRADLDDEVSTGKMTLWAEGNFVRGYLEPREDDGVPLENPELIPIAGDLNNGLLRVAFSLSGLLEDPEVVLFSVASFSFDQEVVETALVIFTLDALEGPEAEIGTIRLTRVAVP